MMVHSQWLKLDPPQTKNYKIDFINEDFGFIASKYHLHKTINGGIDWTLVDLPGAEVRKNDVLMINENIIWCSTDSILGPNCFGAVLLKSEDGGNTWDIKLEHNTFTFKELFFIGEDFGWMANDEYRIFRTIDGGENWTIVDDLPMLGIQGIYFVDELTGWICGNTPSSICKTTDGGLTWQEKYNGYYAEYLKDIEFVNDQKGFASGLDRTMLQTNNGGESWEVIASTEDEGLLIGLPANQSIYDIEFLDENLGWITGGPC